MNICFLAGASTIHTVRWVNAMAGREHNVHLLTMHPSVKDHIDERVHVHKLKIPAPFGYYLNMLEVKSLLKKMQPDLLHVHYASGYGTLARLANFKPALLSVWGSDVYLYPYNSMRSRKILQKNLRQPVRLTATGYALKEQTEKFVTPKFPTAVIPFGIDMDLFKPVDTAEAADDDYIIIGTVKRLKPVYGIDLLLKSTAKLITGLKDCDQHDIASKIKLMIVGEGPELPSLKKLASELNIDAITKFTGAIANDEVPAYLNRFDIYAALSRSESFGVAVLEASACELPVVTSDVGGLPEVVQEGKTGYMVANENTEEAAAALRKLVLDHRLRKSFGKQGRQFVKNAYDWQKNVEQMEDVYIEMISGMVER